CGRSAAEQADPGGPDPVHRDEVKALVPVEDGVPLPATVHVSAGLSGIDLDHAVLDRGVEREVLADQEQGVVVEQDDQTEGTMIGDSRDECAWLGLSSGLYLKGWESDTNVEQ